MQFPWAILSDLENKTIPSYKIQNSSRKGPTRLHLGQVSYIIMCGHTRSLPFLFILFFAIIKNKVKKR
ncbi:hypothetical protein HanRHA438_Chr08g0333441 [Helianthus annuus]|uniref:Uncharacterized protein n=1 Tax=Helianthus annuus TaxID=4232 RepID=A0A9K3IBX3_HELAN|nr:hypothetical protein HanXRQr2_Chr08g0322511 [Helianthus annuus]KAJ0545271.1 hypothetical protein HanIR_Chr08g0348081 [Helianthus annuus]KAJ0896319.1 hypothetical protein HanRHA438_Chr08g0333441 [Helianthus annuus]KAJ0900310.1 hypothetical protein HanPSC8_Chr08g0312411 [Helianthus annuus]